MEQELFNYFLQEHNVILMEGDFSEIKMIIAKYSTPSSFWCDCQISTGYSLTDNKKKKCCLCGKIYLK